MMANLMTNMSGKYLGSSFMLSFRLLNFSMNNSFTELIETGNVKDNPYRALRHSN